MVGNKRVDIMFTVLFVSLREIFLPLLVQESAWAFNFRATFVEVIQMPVLLKSQIFNTFSFSNKKN